MKKRSKGSRGSILIITLVFLLVTMSLLGHMLLGALRARRQLHAERNLRQCELLLRAGVERGFLQTAADEAYRGETHEIAADEASGLFAARLAIEVVPASDGGPARCQVVAEYPLGDEHSVRRSQTVLIPMPTR